MSCCQCEGIRREFDDRQARKDLKRYRRKGARKTTRMLVDALLAEGVDGTSLLDVGGGVGTIQFELLKHGVTRAVHVDASPSYLDVARDEAARLGHANRIDHVSGDFTDVADGLEDADLVTLDRVICCYDDMPALVGASASRARRLYGLVYPRDTWWTRAGERAVNLIQRIRRSPMRIFIHPTEAVDACVRAQGLQTIYNRDTPAWQVVVYRRQNSEAR